MLLTLCHVLLALALATYELENAIECSKGVSETIERRS